MNAAETIQAAIEKAQRLKSEGWTMRGTIDAQLAILRAEENRITDALSRELDPEPIWWIDQAALDLARAILGEE